VRDHRARRAGLHGQRHAGSEVDRARPRLEQATLALSALALLGWVVAAPAALTAAACALAAAAHLLRQWGWQPWVTRGRPILWILHAAYVWLPIGFGLLALAQFGLALRVGGHARAGRRHHRRTDHRHDHPHRARPHRATRCRRRSAEVLAYALVLAAAALRVLLPIVAPQWFMQALAAAALAWGLAFAIYLLIYAPWLTSTRLDGKDG
jgi:uncharacterized protein involved in response to NO